MTKVRGLNKPKFHRPTRNPKGKARILWWEIYSFNHFFITLDMFHLEIQINKWPKEKV